MTEDCLFLNVHTPKNIDLSDHTTSPSDRLPVFFWIHGGAFQTGSGTSSMYDGRYLSNLTNTVVVSINYRLGKQRHALSVFYGERASKLCKIGFDKTLKQY